MTQTLQEGIYFRKKPTIGNSFLILFLRFIPGYKGQEIRNSIASLWLIYEDLKKGIIRDLNIDAKHRSSGNLSVLIGYGSDVFSASGIGRKKPTSFNESWLFMAPNSKGGGSILEGSNINYAADVSENHALSDQIVIQFIADTEFYTHRALVETWKDLHRQRKKNWGRESVRISNFFTGFQRADQRNWLGFHDGVSNMKSMERTSAISINQRHLSSQDKWLVNGTYLAFIRMSINLASWEDIPLLYQELMIGREKLTGCPLVGLDKKGKPLKDRRCPVRGTSEIIDRGNEYFRDHPPYGSNVKGSISETLLRNSHMGQMRPPEVTHTWNKNSSRIFRQGFEFVEYVKEYPNFRVGLNFVSFQNTPERLYKTLTYVFSPLRPNVTPVQNAQKTQIPSLGNFTSVHSAGIFLVPPLNNNEQYPGEKMFLDAKVIPPTMTYKQARRVQDS